MICEIREICGDWSLDINFPFDTVTIYFNSRQNAMNVKRILEVDGSIPNVATVCDMQEVVRCKDCKYAREVRHDGVEFDDIFKCTYFKPNTAMFDIDYCSYGERKEGAD